MSSKNLHQRKIHYLRYAAIHICHVIQIILIALSKDSTDLLFSITTFFNRVFVRRIFNSNYSLIKNRCYRISGIQWGKKCKWTGHSLNGRYSGSSDWHRLTTDGINLDVLYVIPLKCKVYESMRLRIWSTLYITQHLSLTTFLVVKKLNSHRAKNRSIADLNLLISVC